MKKQLNNIYYLSFLIIYLEILTKIFVTKSIGNFYLTIFYETYKIHNYFS